MANLNEKFLQRTDVSLMKIFHLCVKFLKEISIENSCLVIIKGEMTLKSNLVASSQHTHVMFI